MSINYFKEDVVFDLRSIRSNKNWLASIALHYGVEINLINYIFCSDEYLLKINKEYLSHNTYTDIITFDNRESIDEPIEADIFISVERVNENASTNVVSKKQELSRVMVHGLLHLIGLKDKSEEEKKEMRTAEDKALKSLK